MMSESGQAATISMAMPLKRLLFTSLSLEFLCSRSVSSLSYWSKSSTLIRMRRFGFSRIALGMALRTAYKRSIIEVGPSGFTTITSFALAACVNIPSISWSSVPPLTYSPFTNRLPSSNCTCFDSASRRAFWASGGSSANTRLPSGCHFLHICSKARGLNTVNAMKSWGSKVCSL